MPSITWPRALAPGSILLAVDSPARTGPQPAVGSPQIVTSDAGRWLITYQDIPIHSGNLATLRSLIAQSSGGVEAFAVSPWEYRRGASVRLGSTVTASLSATATLRAVSISVAVTTGSILAGDIIGIGERLYDVGTATTPSAGVQTLTIWPPIREAASSSTAVLIDAPVLKARVVDPRRMAAALQWGRHGRLTLEFEEVF